jgi:hypothetical protein
MKDKISVFKNNGEVFDDIQASVQTKKIFIQRSDILIETGDLIQRLMSNGATQTYEVIDPGFHEGLAGIPAGYQIVHKNLGLPEAEKAIQSITYNLSGANSRVNNDSVDNSTNIVNNNNELLESVFALREEIQRLKLSEQDTQNALEVVDAIDSQCQSEKPSKVVVGALIKSLPTCASIASIGSLLLSLLG